MYQRFKKHLDKDEEGLDLNIDFLMKKFKIEFDKQSEMSESDV